MPTSSWIQRETTSPDGEFVEVQVYTREEIKNRAPQQMLPEKKLDELGYSGVIDKLRSKGEGWGLVFPMTNRASPSLHRSYLRMTARRLGIKIELYAYRDPHHLLVVLTDMPTSKLPEPEYLTPQQVMQFEYELKQKARRSLADEPVGEDYRLYVEQVLEQNAQDPLEFGGVLYPLNRLSVGVQQTRLHIEAQRKGARIKAKRWDNDSLMLEFVDYV